MMPELPMAKRALRFNETQIRQEAKRYKALGDETRLKLFRVLEQGERCVCELMELFQVNQPLVSHHIKVLENAGLVQGRRVGKFVYYRVTGEQEPGYPEIRTITVNNPKDVPDLGESR